MHRRATTNEALHGDAKGRASRPDEPAQSFPLTAFSFQLRAYSLPLPSAAEHALWPPNCLQAIKTALDRLKG